MILTDLRGATESHRTARLVLMSSQGTFVGCILAAISANPQVSAVVPDDDMYVLRDAIVVFDR
jgi:hypothetical protein